MRDEDRADALISAFLGGEVTESTELEQLLERSADARRALVEHSTLDGLLQDLLKGQPALRIARPRRTVPAPVPLWAWPAGAAAVALFAVVVALAMRTPKPQPEVARPPAPTQAHDDRKRAEAVLESVRQREDDVVRERDHADENRRGEFDEAVRRVQAEREQAERDLAAARERERMAPPEKPVIPPPPTEAAIARVAEGEVTVAGAMATDLAAGCAVETRGGAVIEYPDGTRVELAESTSIRDLAAAQLFVVQGSVEMDVRRSRPFALRTAHGEAAVTTASMRLIVSRDTTQLEVIKGSAKLTREGKSVEVKAGMFAVATAKALGAAQPIPKDEVLLSMSVDDAKTPPLLTSGTVERGPGNRLCIGGVETGGVSKLTVGEVKDGLFRVRGDEVLSFDYYVDAKASKVNGNINDRTLGKTLPFTVPKLVRGKWTRATIKLADLGVRENDLVISLYLQAPGESGVRLYVDNLQVTRPRKEK